jgi:hypothetical protein
MSKKNLPEEILNFLGGNNLEFSILEHTVDINLQTEYFEFALKNEVQKSKNPDKDIEKLFDSSIPDSDKKILLVQLALIDDVKIFRTLEKFVKETQTELHDWAVLAMNESRMIVESSLTNDKRVFISTGMGGVGNKLRYFCVFVSNISEPLSDFQQKLFQKELEHTLQKKQSVLEEINFFENFISITALIPLTISVQQVLKTVIDDCNQFGNFLSQDFIISNVKKLDKNEIQNLIDNQLQNENLDSEKDIYEINPDEDEIKF